jgi:hypothetical protein
VRESEDRYDGFAIQFAFGDRFRGCLFKGLAGVSLPGNLFVNQSISVNYMSKGVPSCVLAAGWRGVSL